MTAIFALICCIAFDASIGWYIGGIICVALDGGL